MAGWDPGDANGQAQVEEHPIAERQGTTWKPLAAPNPRSDIGGEPGGHLRVALGSALVHPGLPVPGGLPRGAAPHRCDQYFTGRRLA
jgi:hypothetical protein